MGIFPSCSYVPTTVWLHHLGTNEMHGKKAWWELHKDAACCFEQILEASPLKTAAVQPLTSHLANHISKMSKTCWHKTHKWCSMDYYMWTHQCWPTSKNLYWAALWRILGVVLRIFQEWWLIGMTGKWESKESMLWLWLNDNNNDDDWIHLCIHLRVQYVAYCFLIFFNRKKKKQKFKAGVAMV